ncbi:MAG: CrcB family protein [Planctomycetota bacterium]
MPPVVAIALGGAVGAVGRYLVGLASRAWLGDQFAYGTLIVNVAGCFALGLLMHGGLVAAARLPILAHPGVTVGFLGALTTFSTFGYETVRLAEQGQWPLALVNIAANVLLGCGAAAAGIAASRYAPGWFGVG